MLSITVLIWFGWQLYKVCYGAAGKAISEIHNKKEKIYKVA
jgi:hypothetical protein